MTQEKLLLKLLESNSGVNLITELIDLNPGNINDRTLKDLKDNSETSDALKQLTEKQIELLADKFRNVETEAKLQGFKTGVDIALTLTGNKPIYDVLPDRF